MKMIRENVMIKIIISFLALTFVLQPILVIFNITDNVYAANGSYTYDGQDPYKAFNIGREYDCVKYGAEERKYSIIYSKYGVKVSGVPENQKYLFDNGQCLIGVDTSDKSHQVFLYVSNSRATYTGKKTGGIYNRKKYDITFNLRGTYNTGWVNSANFRKPTFSVNVRGEGVTYLSIYLNGGDPTTISRRQRWSIIKKQGSYSNSAPYNGSSSNGGNSSSGNSSSGNSYGGSSSGSSYGYSSSGSSYTQPSNNSSTPTAPTRKTINISDDAKRIYIRDLYKNALHREPSNTEIESHMTGSVYTVSNSIILSPESDDKNKIKTISNEEYAKSLYKYIFKREAGADEYNGYVTRLNNGTTTRGDLIDTFVGSKEFELRKIKNVSTITLNEKLHDAVYNELVKQGFSVISPSSTTIKMYEDYVPEVKQLNINGKEISDLTGLSVFTSLNKLIAYNNSIKDVSELQKIKGLKFLNLNNNKLEGNVKQLSNIESLEELYLDNNSLLTSDTNNAFKNLKNLKSLSLSSNNLTTVTGISGLANLNSLKVENNKLVNTDEIDSLKFGDISLRDNKLYLVGTQREVELPIIMKKAKDNNSKVYTANDYICTDCKVVNGKLILNDGKNIGTVSIKGGIADKTTFTYTCNTKTFTIKDKVLAEKLQDKLDSRISLKSNTNGVYEFEIDENYLKSIRNLDLSTDGTEKINDISGIENFSGLKSLDLSGNKIVNLNRLETLPQLETLKLRRAELTSINMIRTVKTLKQLDVANNNITEISKISNLTNLEDVVLSNNNIGDNLAPLKDLTNLTNLAIANNNVTSLAALGDKSLDKLDISYNKVSSLSNVKAEDVQMENNAATVTLQAGSKEIAVPELLQKVITENGGTNSLEFTDCSINNNKIVLNKGVNSGRILVKDGKYSDFNVIVNQAADTTPPEVKVTYTLNEETGMVDVTLKANEEIKDETFFKRSDDCKSLTKSYDCNTQEVINVRDLANNETPVTITVTQLHNEKIPGLKVFYSNTKPTNQDITLTIKADVPLHNPNSSVAQYYTQSADGKTLTWVMDRNISLFQTIQSEADWQADRQIDEELNQGASLDYIKQKRAEISARTVRITVSGSNIDKVAPEATVEYSTTDMTKGSVRATIWSDEEIELADSTKNYSKAKKSENDKTVYGIVLYYSANASETLTIKDLAGNTATVNIAVNNIDSKLDGLNITANKNSATNGTVSLSAKAGEKITDSQNNQGKLAKALNERFYNAKIQARMQSDVLRVANVDNNGINSDLGIRIAEDNSNDGLKDQLSYEYSENEQGVKSFYDAAGNVDTTTYSVNMIDKDAPVISREADVVNEDGSITVTLVSNEEIQKTEDLLDWELSADGKKLTKTYKSNKDEIIIIKDSAGNETKYTVNVDGINTLKYELEATYDLDKNLYLVKITTQTELKELDGWELSEDKKTLQAYFNEGEKQYVLIEDVNGNSAEVIFELKGEEDNSNQENNANQEENKQDTANTIIPQTGSYAIIAGVLILILSALTAITVVNYMKKD